MAGTTSRLAPALAMAAALLAAAPVQAQMNANPPTVGEKIAALGNRLDPATVAATAALYAPLQPEPPYARLRIHRDLKYGPDPANRLAVFAPEPPPDSARPVLIFVHGSGFIGGGNSAADGPFYDNIGIWAATHGMIGITVDYRHAPQHAWSAAIEDLGAITGWAFRNVAPFGGDPEKVFLMGHSAGATHVADYIAHPELQPPAGAGIAGAILLSGIYDLTAQQLASNEKAYFGKDPARYARRSSAQGLAKTRLPLLAVTAEFDPPAVVAQGQQLSKTACARHRCLRFVTLPKHNHLSEVYAINTRDVQLSNIILDFIRRN